jgi:hypothetical protein
MPKTKRTIEFSFDENAMGGGKVQLIATSSPAIPTSPTRFLMLNMP